MAEHEDPSCKEVQGFATVTLRLLERGNKIRQENGKDPVVSQNEPEEEAEAEADTLCVRFLPPGIVVLVSVDHHGLGQKPPHPAAVGQQERHRGCGRERGVRVHSSKVGRGEGREGRGEKERERDLL